MVLAEIIHHGGPRCRTILLNGVERVGKTTLFHQLGRMYDDKYSEEFDDQRQQNFEVLAKIPTFFEHYHAELRDAIENDETDCECKERQVSLDKLLELLDSDRTLKLESSEWRAAVRCAMHVWRSQKVQEFSTHQRVTSTYDSSTHVQVDLFESMRLLEKLAFGSGDFTPDDMLRCWPGNALLKKGIEHRVIDVDGHAWEIVCSPKLFFWPKFERLHFDVRFWDVHV